MKEKKKKSIFKKWWFWVIAVVIIAAATSGGEEETAKPEKEEPKAVETAAEQPKEEPKKEEPPKNKETITSEEFTTIQNGMSYEEVVEIIGSEGELLSETGTKGDQFYTVMYKWDGEGLGANANFTFQNNKLQNKSQFGLK